MISVKDESNRLTVEGHASTAPKGEDLVCAAVSTLVMTLSANMENKGIKCTETVNDGYYSVEYPDTARETVEFIVCGLKTISALYPKSVQFDIKSP